MKRIRRERWKPIPGWPHYEVSTLGRVRRATDGRGVKAGKVLKHLKGPSGYPQVNLHHEGKRATKPVHRLVLLAFVGPRPEGLQVRHLDGDHTNPRYSNLKYGTPTENYADARKHGTYSHGTRHGKSKLTEAKVKRIRKLRGNGFY